MISCCNSYKVFKLLFQQINYYTATHPLSDTVFFVGSDNFLKMCRSIYSLSLTSIVDHCNHFTTPISVEG